MTQPCVLSARHGRKSFPFSRDELSSPVVSDQSFVHLHLHTEFSLLDGACRTTDVMEMAAAENMRAVAITDHGAMYGIVDFYKAARSAGIKPILGCEVYVAKGSRFERKSEEGKSGSHHLVLVAANETGYGHLIRLVTAAHLEGFYYKPRVDKELLAAHARGLIAMSSCLKGEIPERLVNDDAAGAAQAAGEYAEIFGKENFYLELQDQGIPEQRKANAGMIAMARRLDLPLVATNDVHYLKKEHAAAHEVLLCIQTQTVMSDPKRMRHPTPEFYMKTRAEMAALFAETPEALANTGRIADRCDVELRFGDLHFPIFRVPDGYDQKRYLMELAEDGLRRRYGVEDVKHPKTPKEKEIVDRYQYELGVIEKTGFINYFLVVWDFVNFARLNHISVGPGRGSGAGSLLACALGITGIDPLRYGLIFERFLNPERVSPPDFDIDFCQARRDEVIAYVRGKYGQENVAQIITFHTLGAKTVIRDVGRALEIPYGECDRLARMVPEEPGMTLRRALEMNPEFKKSYETEPTCRRILDYGFVLEGLCRNSGTHAAGVVIGERPLVDIIPLTRDKDKEIITQYAMEPLGDIGLLKMDFLGLQTLTVIQEAVTLIRETCGTTIDVESLPMDDKATYELLKRGDTVAVFQLESSGMRELIRRVGVDRIEDLIAMIALYRPGPMNMLDEYVSRKTGKSAIHYDHPLLEPVLAETYGVMLYQEQVQQAAHVLAGYSLGQGDLLRRAMSKKKPDEMEKQRATFVEGCARQHRIPKVKAERIFDTLAKFAGYGFNKSHSTAYAVLAYYTAWLKAHHPTEFMAAVLSNEMGNAEKLPGFIREAREMELEILPPDVNASGVRFRPMQKAIRFGLAGVKNVGAAAAEAIVAERERGGPYKGLIDFCGRLDGQLVNRKVIESLVRCGAMDSLDANRARLFNNIAFAMSRASAAQRDARSGQGSLFGGLGESASGGSDAELPPCDPWGESELLSGEKDLLGVYMSGHPLSQYARLLERYQLTNVEGLSGLADGTATRLGGLISKVDIKITKKKETMAVLRLEDLDGSVEAVVYPEPYRQHAASLQKDAAILLCGEVVRKDEQVSIRAQEIYPLAEAPQYFAERMSVHVPVTSVENAKLEKLKQILARYPGRTPVVICLEYPSGEKVFMETHHSLCVRPDESLLLEIEHFLGEESVYVAVNPRACRKAKPRTREPYR
jgi:DNA polymerase-3 subunit alpha